MVAWVAGVWLVLGAGSVWAEDWAQWPAPCVTAAAREARISRSLLQAIVWVESRGWPWALNVNAGGQAQALYPSSREQARQWLDWLLARRINVDIGLAQLNVRTLAQLGISPAQALEPCANLRAAARWLDRLIRRHGETWRAIMRYNGRNPAYAHRVRDAWRWFRNPDRERGSCGGPC